MKRIGITRLHMEEDAGKSLHDGFADSVSRTYIDLNRCGTPLVEIVSEPDLRTADEVFEYLTKLKEILLYTGVSDCNMEEGSLRCDANVSVMLKGAKEFGTKAEVKNVNSFRYIRAAVEYEIERQIGVIEDGGRVVQESRLWNNAEGRTYSMRSKEQAHDYRYFPEPDLPPLIVGEEWQKEILKAALPELPEARRARMIAEYGISAQDADDADGDARLCRPVRVRGESSEESEARRSLLHQRDHHAPARRRAGVGAVARVARRGSCWPRISPSRATSRARC
jgi:aspartyl-tRNA(Asn)/glutamyl-tRNA(Gln) amidotransferase subunit B